MILSIPCVPVLSRPRGAAPSTVPLGVALALAGCTTFYYGCALHCCKPYSTVYGQYGSVRRVSVRLYEVVGFYVRLYAHKNALFGFKSTVQFFTVMRGWGEGWRQGRRLASARGARRTELTRGAPPPPGLPMLEVRRWGRHRLPPAGRWLMRYMLAMSAKGNES